MRNSLPTGHVPISRLESPILRMRVHERCPDQSHADVMFDAMMRRPDVQFLDSMLDKVYVSVTLGNGCQTVEEDEDDEGIAY